MLSIPCPWCGLRDEVEFTCAGQSHIARPAPFDRVGDEEWETYLFMRDNPRGEHRERWVHAAGCRQWFNVVRNTVTHEVLAVYRIGATP